MNKIQDKKSNKTQDNKNTNQYKVNWADKMSYCRASSAAVFRDH